jgi:hypothetical protein
LVDFADMPERHAVTAQTAKQPSLFRSGSWLFAWKTALEKAFCNVTAVEPDFNAEIPKVTQWSQRSVSGLGLK